MIRYCVNCKKTVDAQLRHHETLELPTLTCPHCDSTNLKHADYAKAKA